jgi:hypothetical protein
MNFILPRLHLFEFHDLPWFPASLRNGITECLRVLSARLRLETLIAPILRDVIQESGAERIVDLCSGSCGPLIPLQRSLAEHGVAVELVVTDKYPNRSAFSRAEQETAGAIRGYLDSVDATRVPDELRGIRTLFNAFHHFPPARAREILKDAHDKRQPIAIFEITDRSFVRTITNFPGSFLLMLAAIPVMRPRKPVWWIFGYLPPLLPAAFAWDGLVSCLRSYSLAEFAELTTDLDQGYVWRSGILKIPNHPLRLTYFVGIPHQDGRLSYRRP